MRDEETILELETPPVWVLPPAFGCNDEWDAGNPKFSRAALSTYVTQYSLRRFTYPSDALPAFNGLMRRYECLNGEKLHWGLPTWRFDQGLLWSYGNSRRTEKCQLALDGGFIYTVQYPSWSWLGWTGMISCKDINDVLYKRTVSGELDPGLKFYSLMSDGSVSLIGNELCHAGYNSEESEADDITGKADLLDELQRQWKGNTIIEDVKDLQTSTLQPAAEPAAGLPVYDTGRLVFWTSHGRILSWNASAYGKLCIQIDNEVLELDSTISRSSPLKMEDSGNKILVDYIVISKQYICTGDTELQGLQNLHLMLLWPNDTEPGVWSRGGLAIIHEADWLKVERTWETIVLE